LVLLGLLVWLYPSSADFDPYNPFWNGLRDVAGGRPDSLVSAGGLPRPAPGTALIVIPYRRFAGTEIRELKDYVIQGGRLLIADDFGYGNRLLSYMGVKARFSGKPLLDPLFNYKNPHFPKVSFPGVGGEVVLDRPTSLDHLSGGRVLAQTSSFSFLDLNDNGKWDRGEPEGPFPVVAGFSLGRGELLLVSDPSFLINGMLDVAGNRALLSYLTGGARLYIYSPSIEPGPLFPLKQALGTVWSALRSEYGTILLPAAVIILTVGPLQFRRRRHGRGKA